MTKTSRTRNSIINLFTGLGGQLVSTMLRFVVRTFFIHALGKSYLGINSLFSDILTMLSLTELGFDTAISFKLYKPLADGDKKRVRVLMKFYKQAYRVIGAVILVLGICFVPLLPVIIRDYRSLEVLKINAIVIFMLHVFQTVSSYLFFAYQGAIMRANQKKFILDMISIVADILNSIVKILILVFLKNFVIYTASTIVFTILQNIAKAVVTQHCYPAFFEKEEDKLSRGEIREIIKDCMALFFYKVNAVVLKATDNMVISFFIGLATVGIYSNYLLFYTTIKSLLGKFYDAVRASLGNLFAVEDIPTKYRFFKVMNFLAAILYGTAGIGVAACADEMICIWIGEDYVVTQPFAILIGIETFLFGMQLNLGQIRTISGVFRKMWFRPILGIIINIGVSIALVHVIGLYGVILGTIITLLLTNFIVDPRVVHKYSFNNYRPVNEYYRRNLQYLVILLTVGIINMWLCSVLFVGHGWFSVFSHVMLVCVTVPSVFVLIYKNTEECQYLFTLSKRICKSRIPKKR